jgi:hypothetical protein
VSESGNIYFRQHTCPHIENKWLFLRLGMVRASWFAISGGPILVNLQEVWQEGSQFGFASGESDRDVQPQAHVLLDSSEPEEHGQVGIDAGHCQIIRT